MLKEIETLSEDLSKISEVGIEAFGFIKEGIKPDKNWIKESGQKLENANSPRGQTELKVTIGIEKLVNLSSD